MNKNNSDSRKHVITNLASDIAYKSNYRRILKKINFTWNEFYKLGLLQEPQLDKVEIKKFSDKSDNLNSLISNFNHQIKFSPTVTQKQKDMIFNFYYYLFYDLFVKYYNKEELELRNFLGEIFIKHNLAKDKKQAKVEFEIILNKIKREYYYLFLDEFQKIPGYNTVLRAILRKVL
ncbi:hypothetical protein [Mycoplasma seminis]|uniref:KA1 domain-containing protein n=1 Tax=Mycoplasma seminis TaxID=512749 RepID=A0ABY9HCL7_9MOLU|nr:hypothetical protein [Mycoplasma seminis]WLP85935.1 hypothetical protein Q8852_02205 [Mycoplasma seminis]